MWLYCFGFLFPPQPLATPPVESRFMALSKSCGNRVNNQQQNLIGFRRLAWDSIALLSFTFSTHLTTTLTSKRCSQCSTVRELRSLLRLERSHKNPKSICVDLLQVAELVDKRHGSWFFVTQLLTFHTSVSLSSSTTVWVSPCPYIVRLLSFLLLFLFLSGLSRFQFLFDGPADPFAWETDAIPWGVLFWQEFLVDFWLELSDGTLVWP